MNKFILSGLALAFAGFGVTACGNGSGTASLVPTVYAQTESFTYEDFSQDKFDALRGKEAFAVFFHSKSCGTCVGKNKEIISEVSEFQDGTILKMEYSNAPADLKKELGVTGYDTFVVFESNGSFKTTKGLKVDALKNELK